VSLARTLWRENAQLAGVALAHPFVRGIADGSLARDRFAAYIAQDTFFLDGFARAYALALAQSPDRASLDAFADLLAGAREELRLHDAYAARWGIDLAGVVASAATRAYTDFLLARASLGGVGPTCAAMTPCMRLYAHLGQSLAGSQAGPYTEWIQTYADPAFEELAAQLERLLDTHATDEPETHATYLRAMELEIAFFADAL
jgi:thiaminase (transcriptional activator TenA)